MVNTQKAITARATVAAYEATLIALKQAYMTAAQIIAVDTAEQNLAEARAILKAIDVIQ